MSFGETGAVTICTGIVVLVFGVFLLADKALTIAGNILVITGFAIILKSNTLSLLRLEKLHGTAFFTLGIAMMLMSYTLFGVLLEIVGLLMIFKASLPSPNRLLYSFVLRKPASLKQ